MAKEKGGSFFAHIRNPLDEWSVVPLYLRCCAFLLDFYLFIALFISAVFLLFTFEVLSKAVCVRVLEHHLLYLVLDPFQLRLVKMQHMFESLLGPLALIFYSAACEASPLQGTLGKRLFGVKIVSVDLNTLQWNEALKRNLVKWGALMLPPLYVIVALLVSDNSKFFYTVFAPYYQWVFIGSICLLVYLHSLLFFSRENQAQHDRAVNSLVIYHRHTGRVRLVLWLAVTLAITLWLLMEHRENLVPSGFGLKGTTYRAIK